MVMTPFAFGISPASGGNRDPRLIGGHPMRSRCACPRPLTLTMMKALRPKGTVADRASWRRFLGLSAADDTPDHSTISRFRKRLGRRV